VQNSVRIVRHNLQRAVEIGARGVVVHTGSAVDATPRSRALTQVRDAVLPLLDELGDDSPSLLLEPTAGQGQSLCATVSDLGAYLDALDRHPKVGICLDTCHAYAAGHDISTAAGMTRLLDELLAVAGPGRLQLVHANDSMDVLGAGKDRHARIGEGHIGAAPFATLFTHRASRGVPVVLETPGERDAKVEEVALLKKLRDRR
jgi:deoxyribonuclease-4